MILLQVQDFHVLYILYVFCIQSMKSPMYYTRPTQSQSILELQNLSIDESKVHKVRQSTDLRKCRSGRQ